MNPVSSGHPARRDDESEDQTKNVSAVEVGIHRDRLDQLLRVQKACDRRTKRTDDAFWLAGVPTSVEDGHRMKLF